MEYKNKELRIRDLLNLIESKSINLRPPYQRNFIWTPKDQRLLIDSIYKGYPLPNFFILKNENGKYEMVDGQQRATTIYKYYHNEFKDNQKKFFKEYAPEFFLDYRLNIVEIGNFDSSKGESKEEFFYLVNKRGIQLNPAEVNQAYHHDSDFLKLVYRIMDIQQLIELDIFTDKTKLRMNDRGLIEEIVAYLFNGITEKRNAVEALFEAKLTEKVVNEKYARFSMVINKIYALNDIKPIKQTRYKQKNDFYTLFCFINEHIDEKFEVLQYQYKILTFISENDFITPSNEDCRPFMDYAINCVSQSNSKRAREMRLQFFEQLLCNKKENGGDVVNEIIDYLLKEYGLDKIELNPIGKYWLIDLSNLE